MISAFIASETCFDREHKNTMDSHSLKSSGCYKLLLISNFDLVQCPRIPEAGLQSPT